MTAVLGIAADKAEKFSRIKDVAELDALYSLVGTGGGSPTEKLTSSVVTVSPEFKTICPTIFHEPAGMVLVFTAHGEVHAEGAGVRDGATSRTEDTERDGGGETSPPCTEGIA